MPKTALHQPQKSPVLPSKKDRNDTFAALSRALACTLLSNLLAAVAAVTVANDASAAAEDANSEAVPDGAAAVLCVVFVPRLADIPRIADTAYRALCVLQRLISSGNATGTATSSATSSREPPDTDEISRMGLAVFQAIVAAVARRPSRAAMTAMVEGLVLASGEDSQDECAQAAADAIPLLLTPQGAPDEGNGMGRGKVARVEADGLPGRGECELSLDATGMLMRVVKIGGGAVKDSLQYRTAQVCQKANSSSPKKSTILPTKETYSHFRCAQECVRLLATHHAPAVVRVVLASGMPERALHDP